MGDIEHLMQELRIVDYWKFFGVSGAVLQFIIRNMADEL